MIWIDNDMIRGKCFKLKMRRDLDLILDRNSSLEVGEALEQAVQSGCACIIPGSFQSQIG